MISSIKLPQANRTFRSYRLNEPPAFSKTRRLESRTIYAAAHVVADPLDGNSIGAPARLDWEATLAFRQHLWSLGLGVAEAMDTAQRGMGLDWTNALGLIQRSVAAARDVPGAVVFSGVGTDQLTPSPSVTLDDVIRAYEEQIEAVEACGGRIVLMASRALAAAA